VSPSTGIIEASESEVIEITLKELSPDCQKHKVMIISAVQNTNIDAVTFWKTVKPGNYASKSLIVQIITNEEGVDSNDGHVSTQKTLSKQQLELHIHQEVQNGQSLLTIKKQLFSNLNAIPKAIKQFMMKEYKAYLIELLKYSYKAVILNRFQNGKLLFSILNICHNGF
jgi:hypothetical protein